MLRIRIASKTIQAQFTQGRNHPHFRRLRVTSSTQLPDAILRNLLQYMAVISVGATLLGVFRTLRIPLVVLFRCLYLGQSPSEFPTYIIAILSLIASSFVSAGDPDFKSQGVGLALLGTAQILRAIELVLSEKVLVDEFKDLTTMTAQTIFGMFDLLPYLCCAPFEWWVI